MNKISWRGKLNIRSLKRINMPWASEMSRWESSIRNLRWRAETEISWRKLNSRKASWQAPLVYTSLRNKRTLSRSLASNKIFSRSKDSDNNKTYNNSKRSHSCQAEWSSHFKTECLNYKSNMNASRTSAGVMVKVQNWWRKSVYVCCSSFIKLNSCLTSSHRRMTSKTSNLCTSSREA